MVTTRYCMAGSLSATTASPATGIDYRGCSQGEVYIPSTASLTVLQWFSSPDNVTFYPAYSDAATPLALTSAISASLAQSVPFPSGLAGSAFVGISASTAATLKYTIK